MFRFVVRSVAIVVDATKALWIPNEMSSRMLIRVVRLIGAS